MTPRALRFGAARATASLFVSLLVLVGAGCTPPAGPCDGSPCPVDETCTAPDGVPVCVPNGSTDGDGGSLGDGGTADHGDAGTATPGSCSPACSGATPACDFTTGRCVVCTGSAGCDTLAAPTCDTSVPGGVCVGCLGDGDCRPGNTCDTHAKECIPATTDDTPDGGDVSDCTASFECDPPCAIGETCIAGQCKPHQSCSGECDTGFHCEQGQCVLNGGGGPIQVTLRWSTHEDLDLHVVEPGGCEVYYGNRTCNSSASLDLDSNAGCSDDNVDIENVIYDAGSTPPTGTYTVRVDDYERCEDAVAPVGYQVLIRENGNEFGYCGQFTRSEGDGGSAHSGTTIATFTYP